MTGSPLAFAGKAVCRSDPIVVLSNGDIVDLYADIETEVSNITSVEYVLHGPPGVTVVRVLFPNPVTAGLEKFSYKADGTTTKITATTTVKVKSKNAVNVTTYMDLLTLSKLKLYSTQQTGKSGQLLSVFILR